jgi:hypothetical protein
MNKFRTGDRVWVRNPSLQTERKIGTVMETKKTRKGVRYRIEWETDLTEVVDRHPGYLAEQITSAHNGKAVRT